MLPPTIPPESSNKIPLGCALLWGRIRAFASEHQKKLKVAGVITLILFTFLYVTIIRAPLNFPQNKSITIEEGAILDQISRSFENKHIVQSGFWLRAIVIVRGGEKSIMAGDYFFPRKQNIFSVARIISTGEFGLTPIRVTIHEGFSTADMAEALSQTFNLFDKEEFLKHAQEKEGYLFPDTYFFLPNVKEKKIVKILEDTFFEKIEALEKSIEAFGKPLHEIITMASIIEREARTPESRRIISGILWSRIELGIPLQVDVTFDYINGKNTFELTQDDLFIESPYNTYRNKGLPPGPIASPSLDSIEAAVNPTETPYLYFLADMEGTIHYSETFEEHKQNKFLYLR